MVLLPPFQIDWIINYLYASMSLTSLLFPNKCNANFVVKACRSFSSFQNSFDVNHIWKSCMEWWKNVQNWAHTLWFVQLKTIAWIVSMQSRAQWVLVLFLMNFLVLFTESNNRVRWANNTNNAEEIAKFLHGLHTQNEQTTFLCIFYLLLFSPFTFVTLLNLSYSKPRCCCYYKSETKVCSGNYLNDLFCRVYGSLSGQVQANKLRLRWFQTKCILRLPYYVRCNSTNAAQLYVNE